MKRTLLIIPLLLILNSCSNNKNLKPSVPKVRYATSIEELSPIKYSQDIYVNYINQIRAKGAKCAPPAPPLKSNYYLERAAFAHANDMATNHFLKHTGSGTQTDPAKKAPGIGSIFFERVLFFGYPAKTYDLVGENITYIKNSIVDGNKNRFASFKKAIDIFLADPPHCKILMEPRFRDVGVGYKSDGNGIYWVVDFGEIEN